MAKKTVFTTSQAAKILNVSKETIINWINKGKLSAYETYGKHFRVHLKDIIAFAKESNIYIDEKYTDLQKKRFLLIDPDPRFADFLKGFLDVYFPEFELQYSANFIEGTIKLGELIPNVCFINEESVDDVSVYIKHIKNNSVGKGIRFILICRDELENTGADFAITKPVQDRHLFKIISSLLQ